MTTTLAFETCRPTSRIDEVKRNLFKGKCRVSLERAKFYTESYQQTEGATTMIRRAKATIHI